MSELSYLEKLLEGVEVEWLFLSEIVELKRGKRLVKSQLSDVGKYAVYQNSMTPLGYYHQSNTSTDTTYIICAGAAGEIGFSTSPLWAADDVYYLVSPEKLSSKYIYYFLLTQKSKILSQVRRASIPRLSRTAFEKIPVPIPCPNNPKNRWPSSLKSSGFWINLPPLPLSLPLSLPHVKNSTTTIVTSC
jgi:type I restriction enzyme S subunit